MTLKDLKGLGPKSEKQLNGVGIFTRSDLKQIGPVNAFIKLSNASDIKPSLNFLYAMVGALEDKHWTEIAKNDKQRLLMELEGYKELEKIFGKK
ncbi:MAG: TfoX/Sxy family protein [Proteobacteria bacterium]|nr:TfoX/Sxy family protein [Pseudomonadota bacterium]